MTSCLCFIMVIPNSYFIHIDGLLNCVILLMSCFIDLYLYNLYKVIDLYHLNENVIV